MRLLVITFQNNSMFNFLDVSFLETFIHVFRRPEGAERKWKKALENKQTEKALL